MYQYIRSIAGNLEYGDCSLSVMGNVVHINILGDLP